MTVVLYKNLSKIGDRFTPSGINSRDVTANANQSSQQSINHFNQSSFSALHQSINTESLEVINQSTVGLRRSSFA
jgi:hypothetical protein